VNIVLNFILIPFWKENAAAFTTVIAEGISFFWCMYEGKKYTQLIGVKSILMKVICGCVGIVVVVLALARTNMGMIAYTISVIILSVVVYFGIEIALKNEAVVGLVKGLVNRFKKR
jgi:O-antigen/teichoic acid export membrane protein